MLIINKLSNYKKPCNSCDFCCPICLDNEYFNLLKLKCDHIFHKDCITNYVQSEINNKKHHILCPLENCKKNIGDEVISTIIQDENILIDYIKNKIDYDENYCICSKCKKTYCEKKNNNFINYCQTCETTHCFQCGNEHNSEINCFEASIIDKKIIDDFYKNKNFILKICPHCYLPQEKLDGCNIMLCGGNTDNNKLRIQGCGKKFNWNNAKVYNINQNNLDYINNLNIDNLNIDLEIGLNIQETNIQETNIQETNIQENNIYNTPTQTRFNYSIFWFCSNSYEDLIITIIGIIMFLLYIFGILMIFGVFNNKKYVCNDNYGNCEYYSVNSIISNITIIDQYYDFNNKKFACEFNEIFSYENYTCNTYKTDYFNSLSDCDFVTKSLINTNQQVYIPKNINLKECVFDNGIDSKKISYKVIGIIFFFNPVIFCILGHCYISFLKNIYPYITFSFM